MLYDNVDTIRNYIHGLAVAESFVSRELATDLHELAELIGSYPHALPQAGACPYCRATVLFNGYRPEHRGIETMHVSVMRVVKRLCPEDQEYIAGYRALWRCAGCGELELR